VLAVMLVAIVFLSIVSFVAIIVGTATGLERGDFQNGLWPVISFLPLIGLPIAFLMVLTLLIVHPSWPREPRVRRIRLRCRYTRRGPPRRSIHRTANAGRFHASPVEPIRARSPRD
jgi:hypothetical protein